MAVTRPTKYKYMHTNKVLGLYGSRAKSQLETTIEYFFYSKNKLILFAYQTTRLHILSKEIAIIIAPWTS